MPTAGIKRLKFMTADNLAASNAVGIEQNDVDGFYYWVGSKTIGCFF